MDDDKQISEAARAMGKKGYNSLIKKHGIEHMKKIAKISGEKRHQQRLARERNAEVKAKSELEKETKKEEA